MLKRTLRRRNILRLLLLNLILRSDTTQLRRLVRITRRLRHLISNLTDTRIGRSKRTHLQSQTTITIPRRALSNIQLTIKSLNIGHHLIATDKIRLIKFTQHTMFITNTRNHINQHKTLFLKRIHHRVLAAVQIAHNLGGRFLVRLFGVITTRTRVARQSVPSRT